MGQPITDYAAFFASAGQAVQELEALNTEVEQLEADEKKLESSLKGKQRSVTETISQTVKQRKEEITKSYDAELGKALGAARPIIDVEARSRRNIMPQRQAEILLPELLLSRLKVHEVEIRPFEVVEGDVFHAIGIDIEPFGKREVAVLRPFELVVR